MSELYKNKKHFVAICNDQSNDPFGFNYSVYFVNNSDEEIQEIELLTGSSCSEEDNVIVTSTASKKVMGVEPKSFIKIENADEGCWDFIVQYDIFIKSCHEEKKLRFVVGKYLKGATRSLSIPILNKSGRTVFPT